MSYDARETSVAEGKPIALYEFARGDKTWLYTGADRDLGDFKAIAISDEGIKQSGSPSMDDVSVTLPTNTPIVQQYARTPPSDSIYLTIRRAHLGEAEVPVQWVGIIMQVKRINSAESRITCQPLSATLKRDGVRLGWERNCPHMLYDQNCKVNKDLHRVDITEIEVLNGQQISAAALGAYEDHHFSGGFLEWDMEGGVKERRPVDTHLGVVLTMLGFTDGMIAGMPISVYPGCFRVPDVCNGKFNNMLNYGGIPHLPMKSPFDGNPVF